jgi:hypothetical protein
VETTPAVHSTQAVNRYERLLTTDDEIALIQSAFNPTNCQLWKDIACTEDSRDSVPLAIAFNDAEVKDRS